jgi:predicted phage terminase large subunit-like protein
MFQISQDDKVKNAVIVAFRGSAKSTIMTLSYPIWAMVGKAQKKFIVLLSQTQQQSKLILSNIKYELENNELLISDFGPFYDDAEEWKANSLVNSKYGTRITALSSGESIRGLRHKESRPDAIICDDVEDLSLVKTKEGRDKVFNWLTGDVIPAGDMKTKFIIIGNLLHEDSLMMRLKKSITENKFEGVYKEYSLIDTTGKSTWKGKYPNFSDLEKQHINTVSESAWQREYLLRIISDEDQVVHPEWIHYYDELPDEKDLSFIATAVDLAISEKETADYTAMVTASLYNYPDGSKLYIHSNPINKRMSFPDTVEAIKDLSDSLGGVCANKIFIEDVQYQSSLIQELQKDGYPAEGSKPRGQDKRSRLSATTYLIKSGKVLFPRNGAEDLIRQLTGFGVEKHDDLADAFSILIHEVMNNKCRNPNYFWQAWLGDLQS